MFNIKRTENEPIELTKARYSLSHIPTQGELFEKLNRLCNRRCYLCEGEDKSIVIEHVDSHKEDAALKYSWNNLLLGCSYCNSIKNDTIDKKNSKILNPSIEDEDVEVIDILYDKFEYHFQIIQPSNCCEKTQETVKLLENIYNGYKTPMKIQGRESLVNNIDNIIKDLDITIERYRKAVREFNLCSTEENEKTMELRLEVIKDELKRHRQYFKIKNCYTKKHYPDLYEKVKPSNLEYL